MLAVSGCKKQGTPQERYAAAKTLLEQTAKEYHIPSAEKTGAAREKLISQAAHGYEQVLQQYPEQTIWCAQALRNLGSVRLLQGKTNEAVRVFSDVARKYPQEEWEVLQAWKAAGDTLWEIQRSDEAKGFYRQIVQRFDKPDAAQVVKLIVKGAKARLGM